MQIFKLYWLLFSFFSINAYALVPPELIDIKIESVESVPALVPANLTLIAETEYLLVIENAQNYPVAIMYADFGQKGYTYLIKGTPTVTQESLLLMPQSTVTWHLKVLADGEFEWYAVHSGNNQAGDKGKITVAQAKKVRVEPIVKTVTALAENDEQPKVKPQIKHRHLKR